MSSSKKYDIEKKYLTTKRGHLSKYLSKAKDRIKNTNIPFDLDLGYLESIATDICPVFGTPFVWGRNKGKRNRQTPSLDRIIPELGYVKGNVAFISSWANTIKSDATEKELYAVADWLHDKRKEVLNAKTNTTTPIPARIDRESQSNSQLGTIPTAGAGEDSDDAHHHCGADARKDADHRPQTSSGDSVGARDQEVGTPMYPEGFKDPWEYPTETIGTKD